MGPGTELNTLVAEKVMGWKKEEFVDTVSDGLKVYYFMWRTPNGNRKTSTPSYSTDISAAWPVAEKMRGLGFSYIISTNSCTFAKDGIYYFGDADTTPHAICLAALRAVGELK